MSDDRNAILLPQLRVHPDEIKWYFIGDYYDGPISGLAYFRDQIYRFCCFQEDIPEHYIYVLQQLTTAELAEEMRIKEKFEALVGTHWSFDKDGNPFPRVLFSGEMSKKFFEEEKPAAPPQPWDRTVVAWFDNRIDTDASPN